ncbi:hypothetical protein IW261DRAFT_1417263 [Armillaria novae-zelandiae]|uniref:Uncharacterized protein n=1 Tax=Armillaria novae-zelandiae TaxID=153914 RepID=A0AA39PGB8_9AGAR|nr:hypothetical protein IW261DRAFT_1417263 [Armillaria novae-zelandiae]
MSQLMQPTNIEDPTCCLECNGGFPKKAKPGPCGRCFMIELVAKKDGVDSVRYQNLMSHEQCRGCGAVGKNFTGGYCYNCCLPEDDAAEQTCISRFQAQMLQGKQCQELNHHSGQATNPPPVSQAHFCRSREPELLFIPPPPPSLPLNSESLNCRCNIDLFQLKVEYGKLHEVYNEHVNQPDAHEFFGPEVVKKKAGAGVTMHWELLINVAKYEQWTGYIIPPQLGSSGWNRGHVKEQDDDEQAPLAKRTALCPVTSYRVTPMCTQFRNLTSQGPSATKVQLQFCHIHLNDEGQPILNDDGCYSWDLPQDGMLNDVFTSKGHLKKVYQLTMSDGTRYAAKRLYNAGNQVLTPQYNNCQLEAEVLTQKLGAYMLEGLNELNNQFGIMSACKTGKTMSQSIVTSLVVDKLEEDIHNQNGPDTIKDFLAQDGHIIPRDMIRKGLKAHNAHGAAQPLRMGPVGIAIYEFRDKASGRIIKLVAVPNAHDSNTIGHLYLDVAEENGVIPMQITVDKGSETGIMFAHQTALRHVILIMQFPFAVLIVDSGTCRTNLAPDVDTIAWPPFVALTSINNIVAESLWCWMRKTNTGDIERIIKLGRSNGIFIPASELHVVLFQWLWSKIVQHHLNEFSQYWNAHQIQKQEKKLLPSGSTPNDVYHNPGAYDLERVGIPVSGDLI